MEDHMFKVGDKVIYVPITANGNPRHESCVRGVVMAVPVGKDTVVVRYSGQLAGKATYVWNLVLA